MKLYQKIFLNVALLLSATILINGQNTFALEVDEIVKKASTQQIVYVQTFKNLFAEETKIIELYDEKGNVEKKRVIISNFIVYQLLKDENRIAEFRNVISVNGEAVKNSEKRAQKFFEKIVKAESSEKKLNRLTKESLRYDPYIKFHGFTLFPSLAISENLKPYFDFELIEKNEFEGDDVFVVEYEQTKASPDLSVNAAGKDIQLNGRIRGRLWVDVNTFQVWREERVRTIQPEKFAKPVIISEEIYEYQKSDFGIPIPEKIVYVNYRIKALSRSSVKDAKVTLEYGKFSKPETEVKSADVK